MVRMNYVGCNMCGCSISTLIPQLEAGCIIKCYQEKSMSGDPHAVCVKCIVDHANKSFGEMIPKNLI